MALKVKWSAKAKLNYSIILLYLEEHWTEREIETFIKRTDEVIGHISKQPYMFRASSSKKIRKAVISKQNSLFYLVRNDEIYLITFFDNRQDPQKNKY